MSWIRLTAAQALVIDKNPYPSIEDGEHGVERPDADGVYQRLTVSKQAD